MWIIMTDYGKYWPMLVDFKLFVFVAQFLVVIRTAMNWGFESICIKGFPEGVMLLG